MWSILSRKSKKEPMERYQKWKMMKLAGKTFKSTIINIFKELKENEHEINGR